MGFEGAWNLGKAISAGLNSGQTDMQGKIHDMHAQKHNPKKSDQLSSSLSLSIYHNPEKIEQW